MSGKKLIVDEPIIIDENAVVSGKGLKDEEVMEVEAPNVIIETKADTVKLVIKKAFTDKYTNEKYKVGKVYSFSFERAKELLADSRELVLKSGD